MELDKKILNLKPYLSWNHSFDNFKFIIFVFLVPKSPLVDHSAYFYVNSLYIMSMDFSEIMPKYAFIGLFWMSFTGRIVQFFCQNCSIETK